MAPSKVYNHYVIAHDYKLRPGNLLGAILSHVVLRTVSLRDVNSWIRIVLYFFSGEKRTLPSTQRASMDAGDKTPQCPHLSSHLLEDSRVTVAVKCYEGNCHYVALI